MPNSRSNASQSLKETDFPDHHQICSPSLEEIVLEDGHTSIQVTCHNIRQLISLTTEHIIVRIRHSSINTHLNDFFLFFDSFSITSFAFIFLFYHLSLATTLITTSLNLSPHSWAHLYNFHSYTISFTCLTFHAITATLAFTISTHSISGDLHIFHCPRKYLLQGNLNFHKLRLHFLRPIVLLLFSIEKIKDVASHSWRSSIFDSFLTILIIQLPLFRISESITSIFKSTETSWITSSIRMLFKCFFSERFFDMLSGRILCNF